MASTASQASSRPGTKDGDNEYDINDMASSTTTLAMDTVSTTEKVASTASQVFSRPTSRPGSKEGDVKFQTKESASSSITSATDTATEESSLPQGIKFVAIIATLMLCCFLAALELTIVATAVPAITETFNSLDDVGWYGSASYLTQATFQSTWGKAYGHFDLKWTLISAICVFELGNLISGVAPSSAALIAGRAIAGIGGSGVIGGVFTIIAFVTSKRWVPMCVGLVGATFSVASVVGPLVGGVLTTRVSWRWVFYFSLPIGGAAILALLVVFKTPDSAKQARQPIRGWRVLLDMDFVGTALITASTACFLLAMQWGGSTKPWSSPPVVAALVIFVVLMLVFFVNEHIMSERALAPPRLLKKWPVTGNCILTFFIAGAYFPLIYFLPIYFQAIQKADAQHSGFLSIPFILGVSVFTIATGAFISKTNSWTIPAVVGTLIVVAGTALIRTLNIQSSSAMWIGYQVLGGIGIGITLQVPNIANQKQVELRDIPQVIGTTLFVELLGAAFFISASQALFANGLVAKLKVLAPELDGKAVLEHGALHVQTTFGDNVAAVLESYMTGLQHAFSLGFACAIIAAATALVIAGGMFLRGRRIEQCYV